MLSFELYTRIGEGPIVACSGHIVFTTVAGQGWLAGPKPSLDAAPYVAGEGSGITPRNLLCSPVSCCFGLPRKRPLTCPAKVPRDAPGLRGAAEWLELAAFWRAEANLPNNIDLWGFPKEAGARARSRDLDDRTVIENDRLGVVAHDHRLKQRHRFEQTGHETKDHVPACGRRPGSRPFPPRPEQDRARSLKAGHVDRDERQDMALAAAPADDQSGLRERRRRPRRPPGVSLKDGKLIAAWSRGRQSGEKRLPASPTLAREEMSEQIGIVKGFEQRHEGEGSGEERDR
jgi:hypothetical protein